MIDTIFKGIMDKFSGSTFSTAIGGRLYAYEAPQNPTYPYCVFEQISGFKDRDFTDVQEDVLVRFKIVDSSNTVATVADAETKLFALFDEATLTVSGYTNILMERQNNNLLKMQDELDDAITFWNAISAYRILTEVN